MQSNLILIGKGIPECTPPGNYLRNKPAQRQGTTLWVELYQTHDRKDYTGMPRRSKFHLLFMKICKILVFVQPAPDNSGIYMEFGWRNIAL
jgi:hypothetical protein